jgi:hypothetical protein
VRRSRSGTATELTALSPQLGVAVHGGSFGHPEEQLLQRGRARDERGDADAGEAERDRQLNGRSFVAAEAKPA